MDPVKYKYPALFENNNTFLINFINHFSHLSHLKNLLDKTPYYQYDLENRDITIINLISVNIFMQ